ncbi:MAG: ribosomal protein S18-alanine N-acetyltransferase [Lactovum sp.]
MRVICHHEIKNPEKLTQEIYCLLSNCYEKSPWSKSMILSDFSKIGNYYYLLYDNGQLLAFLSCQMILDEIEITNLAVDKNYRQKGLAIQLMKELTKFSATLFLEVRESNQKARKLYEKLGFSEFNRRKNYYQQPLEDALLLRLKTEQLNQYFKE